MRQVYTNDFACTPWKQYHNPEPRHLQDSIVDYNRRLAQTRAVRHAILLHTSLDYFYLGSARAKGTATLCDADGTESLFTAAMPIRGILRPGTEADFGQLCASLK